MEIKYRKIRGEYKNPNKDDKFNYKNDYMSG